MIGTETGGLGNKDRELCKKLKFDHITKWYMHEPEFVIEMGKYKFLF